MRNLVRYHQIPANLVPELVSMAVRADSHTGSLHSGSHLVELIVHLRQLGVHFNRPHVSGVPHVINAQVVPH